VGPLWTPIVLVITAIGVVGLVAPGTFHLFRPARAAAVSAFGCVWPPIAGPRLTRPADFTGGTRSDGRGLAPITADGPARVSKPSGYRP
jgi:hypothetical protein